MLLLRRLLLRLLPCRHVYACLLLLIRYVCVYAARRRAVYAIRLWRCVIVACFAEGASHVLLIRLISRRAYCFFRRC